MAVRPNADDATHLPATPEAAADAMNGEGEPAAPRVRRRRRWIRRTLAVIAALLVVSVVGGLVYVRSTPFGAAPAGDRLARIEQSPQWHDGGFADPWPQWMSPTAAIPGGGSDTSSPNQVLSIAATDTSVFRVPPTQGLRITWFGHSSTLMEIDGLRVLIDPVWGDQAALKMS